MNPKDTIIARELAGSHDRLADALADAASKHRLFASELREMVQVEKRTEEIVKCPKLRQHGDSNWFAHCQLRWGHDGECEFAEKVP